MTRLAERLHDQDDGDDDVDKAGQALARGLARHALAWARAAGADDAAARAVGLAAQALCEALADGHVCLPIERLDSTGAPACGWAAALRASHIVEVRDIAAPGARAAAMPLVLDPQGRLYLQRHFRHEQQLARRLQAAATGLASPAPAVRVAALATALDAAGADTLADGQKLAVALALRQRLAIVSGGPGTGKTTMVVHLLAALLQAEPGLRVALAAPTGKAALRMTQAIAARAERWPADLRERLTTTATTVHRLLGLRRDGSALHDAEQPLALDVLIVDEASMLDLVLATRLLDAVPPHARIVLLGDRHQLAAVEAGAVFAELASQHGFSPQARQELAATCRLPAESLPAAAPDAALADCTVELRDSHRFAAGSPIGALAAAIRDGRPDDAITVLRNDSTCAEAPLVWHGQRTADSSLRQHLQEALQPYLRAVAAAVLAPRAHDAPGEPGDAADAARHRAAHAAFSQLRVLCAVRRGARGVETVNALLERHARATLARLGVPMPAPASPWYPGRALMVTRNAPAMGLFNGDIGIVMPGPDGAPLVTFEAPDGNSRSLAPARMPAHETAFAMTVHKAQGSEFDHAIVLLPDGPNRMLSRELLYTAVTRARRQVTLVADAAAIARAVATPTRRDGGLAERLREAQ